MVLRGDHAVHAKSFMTNIEALSKRVLLTAPPNPEPQSSS